MDRFSCGSLFNQALTTDWASGTRIMAGIDSHLKLFMTLSGSAPTEYHVRILYINKAGVAFQEDCFIGAGDGKYSHKEKYLCIEGTKTLALANIQVPDWSVIEVSARRVGGDETTSLSITGEAHSPYT
jgi:hypothetical protein